MRKLLYLLPVLALLLGCKAEKPAEVTFVRDDAARKVDVNIGGTLFTSFIYPEDMEKLLSLNPGMRSRVPYTIEFPNYSREDLYRIFDRMASEQFIHAPGFDEHAKRFFMDIRNAPCQRICIENPRPLKCVELPKETQRIQPYEYGEPWTKLTYLWLKGLSPLVPTQIVSDYKPYVSCGTSRNKGNPDKSGMSRRGGAQKVRSKTFPGIARAMAEQWG